MVVAAAGYLEFGPATKGDIFLSYASGTDASATIGRTALSFHLAMTFPLIFNAFRLSVHNLCFAAAGPDLTAWQAVTYTFCLVPPIVAIGTIVPEISTLFSFNGSLFGAFIVYIFPAALYMKIVRDRQPEMSNLWALIIPTVVVLWGAFMMLTGTTVTALKKAHVL